MEPFKRDFVFIPSKLVCSLCSEPLLFFHRVDILPSIRRRSLLQLTLRSSTLILIDLRLFDGIHLALELAFRCFLSLP